MWYKMTDNQLPASVALQVHDQEELNIMIDTYGVHYGSLHNRVYHDGRFGSCYIMSVRRSDVTDVFALQQGKSIKSPLPIWLL